MFSPSLVSMLFQSFDPPGLGPPTIYRTMSDVVGTLQRRLAAAAAPTWPALPIIGLTKRYDINHPSYFQNYVRFGEGQNAVYFWGRVPIDLLIKYLAAFYSIEAGQEYIDLGTALREVGSGSQFDRDCANYLSQTASAS